MTISNDSLEQAASDLAQQWLDPHQKDGRSPPDLTLGRAYVLTHLLTKRMHQLVQSGTDPRGMTLKELLPDIDPNSLDITQYQT